MKAVFFFLAFTSIAYAVGEEAKSAKNLMQELLYHMTKLKTYMVSEEKFSEPSNFKTIDAHLKEMTLLSKEAAHYPQLQSPGFRVSREALESHILETEKVFRGGNKKYARWMLNSTYGICMSCHTQIPSSSVESKDFGKLDNFASTFDQAEFLFATRSFDKAKSLYEDVIVNFPKDKIKTEDVETSLKRMITYFARVQRNPEAALSALKKYAANDKLPVFLKEDIKIWSKAFTDWSKEKLIDLKTATDADILKFAQKNLDPKVTGYLMTADNPRAALYLKVSGILYDYLQQHPQSAITPDLLYWLAICDKGLNNNFFYSLGDIYLKECILKHPQSAIAKKCYAEYESSTLLSYSGSSGTHVPADVRAELSKLKKLIESKP